MRIRGRARVLMPDEGLVNHEDTVLLLAFLIETVG
jgi:hypothetical protein